MSAALFLSNVWANIPPILIVSLLAWLLSRSRRAPLWAEAYHL